MSPPESACPDANQLTRFLAVTDEPAARAELERHIDRCAACRRLVAGLAEELASTDGGPLATPAEVPGQTALAPIVPGRLRRGTPVGRFLVLKCIGVGGMGIVYEAY